MNDQDSRSLSLEDLIGKVSQEEYTLEEAVDRICMMNPCPSKPAPFQAQVKKALKIRFGEGSKLYICVNCHKKYEVKKTIRAKELKAFCQSVGWKFSDEEVSEQEDQRTKGLIEAEGQFFELMREVVFCVLNNELEIDDDEINRIIKKEKHNFSDLLQIISFLKGEYPDQITTLLPADSTIRKVFTIFNKVKKFSEKK